MTVIRVLLADDHEFVRQGLTDLLSTCADLEVVAVCADGSEVVEAAERTRPDVVLLDVAMPVVDGLEAARRLRAIRPDARIVMLTAMPSAAAMDEALRTVACGGTAWSGGGRVPVPTEHVP